MLPGRFDILAPQGSDYTKVFAFKTESDDITDLTDYLARVQIRERLDDEDALLTLAPTVDEVEGTVTLVITNVQTAALAIQHGYWDMELYLPGAEEDDPDTEVVRVVEGSFFISPEVTHA